MDDDYERQREEFADHQAEIAGISNGRINRFLPEDAVRGARRNSSENNERSAAQTLLDMMLLNPAYRAAYDRVWNLIGEAQTKLDIAMARNAANIDRLETLIEDLEDRAAKTPEGQAAFRSADGSVYTADGRRLSETDAASLRRPPSERNGCRFAPYSCRRSFMGTISGRARRAEKRPSAREGTCRDSD